MIIPTPKTGEYGDGVVPLRTGDGISAEAAAAVRAAEWLRDGEPIAEENSQRVTMFRFVFPVKRSSR